MLLKLVSLDILHKVENFVQGSWTNKNRKIDPTLKNLQLRRGSNPGLIATHGLVPEDNK